MREDGTSQRGPLRTYESFAPSVFAVVRWARARVLRVPLAAKITGANALLLIVPTIALVLQVRGDLPMEIAASVFFILGAGLVINVVLIRSALHPVHELERVARLAHRGDLSVRAEPSELADRQIRELTDTFNELLHVVSADHDRLHRFATESAAATDGFRARLGHELHERMAQRATATLLQLSALQRECTVPAAHMRVDEAIQGMAQLVDELRWLAAAVHPPSLDRLGLVPALHAFAERCEQELGIVVEVDGPQRLPLTAAGRSVLYGVVRESVEHAADRGCSRVQVTLRGDAKGVALQVRDDGDTPPADEEARRDFTLLRARLELLGGALASRHTPGVGAHINVTLPTTEEAHV